MRRTVEGRPETLPIAQILVAFVVRVMRRLRVARLQDDA